MNNLPLEFHPDARVEALEAHDWYAVRRPSAAEAFQTNFKTLAAQFKMLRIVGPASYSERAATS